MSVLGRELRSVLEKAVIQARDLAEKGAAAVVQRLGVGDPAAPSWMTDPAMLELRKRLREHARFLGDARDPRTGAHATTRLVAELAYQHWHRMLFARFLSENGLLMHPDSVPVTLAECAELAPGQGAANAWELAARYAARMLPQIFRPDSPVFEVTLPPEVQVPLERLLENLDSSVFTADDSLGWVYQFWQSRKKDEINKSEVKIGADQLPAVTQLFTEPYMVKFLLHNTLGAWWAGKVLKQQPELAKTAADEAQLRRQCALPGLDWEYLRFVRGNQGTGPWQPAAGVFEQWPGDAKELTVLDPCCGSGHFLVAVLEVLARLRMAQHGEGAREAIDGVVSRNLHGLELDERCTQIAAFNVALAAWRFPGAGGYRALPPLSLACSGLPMNVAKEELKLLSRRDDWFKVVLEELHQQFQHAPVLGSLLNPSTLGAARQLTWRDVSASIEAALAKTEAQDAEQTEAGVVAKGLSKAAALLSGRYTLVVTNVPYLARGKQGDVLREYCEANYPEAKNDIATAFLERCLKFCQKGGSVSIVLPQNWLFLTSYRKFREKLLRQETWNFIGRLGPQAFQTPMWDFNVQLLTMTHWAPGASAGLFEGLKAHWIRGLDVSESRSTDEKAAGLQAGELKEVEQARQLENPDARVGLEETERTALLNEYCSCIEGLTTGDLDRFVQCFWEGEPSKDWEWFIQNVAGAEYYGGRTERVLWESGKGSLHRSPTAHNFPSIMMNGRQILGKGGLRITQMNRLPVTLYCGELFGKSAATLVPHDPLHLPAIWCFCSSPEYYKAVRRIDQKLNVTNATLVKVPFDLEHWQKVAAEKYPNGLPKPYSDDPTQWLFHGHPEPATQPLQVAVARLLGYRWPAESDSKMELSDEARAWITKAQELNPLCDADGIVCLPPVRGELPAHDRVRELLAHALGDGWATKVEQSLAAVGCAGWSVERWLRDAFFEQHNKLFQNKPFIWHVWDGLKDGFSALVNYHKLNRSLLETLTYNYLGDWILRQQEAKAAGQPGADERLAAAQELQRRLQLIHEGEPPYDIFVRWKPLHQQPMGWEPDLNDGVRLNIRPFMEAKVLRKQPNIKWDKDRGKDPSTAPWGPDRINDRHFTLAEKRKAREEPKA